MDHVYGTTSEFSPSGLKYLRDCQHVLQDEVKAAVERRKIHRCAYFEGLRRWVRTITLSLQTSSEHLQNVLNKPQVWAPGQMDGLGSLVAEDSDLFEYAEALDGLFQEYRSGFISLSERRDEVWHSDEFIHAQVDPDENSGERLRRLCLEDDDFREVYQRLVDTSISESIHEIAHSTLDVTLVLVD
jgi:hypothetical protein